MLDRQVVKEFLFQELKERETNVPKFINKKELIEAFCQFTEDDYYEWLKDNFKTFFNHGNPDWTLIGDYIKEHKIEPEKGK
jgi:hypothetical protein